MDYLAERGLIRADSRTDLLGNGLVLVAPTESGVSVEIAPGFDLPGALAGGRLADGRSRSRAGRPTATRRSRASGCGARSRRTVVRADNVRVALASVARGEAPLGIVYRSDAMADLAVRLVAVLPPDSHPPIIYPSP